MKHYLSRFRSAIKCKPLSIALLTIFSFHAHSEVYISELHYDNEGADVDEAIELAGPIGTELDGWSLVLYNGSNDEPYNTINLDGSLIGVENCDEAYLSIDFPANGIQNGSPDAIALVDPQSTVIEFISYEGELVAATGVASGLSSTDIGVSETSSTPVGYSLQKIDGVWNEPQENTFDSCNSATSIDDGTDDGTDDIQEVFIHQIQGSADELAIAGNVKVEAIVTASFQGTNQLDGFFIQEEDSDADSDSSTSEGIFVFCPSCETTVAIGDKVSVVGESADFFSMTQITASSIEIIDQQQALPGASSISLPLQVEASDLDLATAEIDSIYERYESMLIQIDSTLTVTEIFNLGRFGEVLLSANGKIRQFTDASLPSVDGYIAQQIDRAERVITLDDGSTSQNNSPVFHPQPGFTFDNAVRGGNTIENLTGVLNFAFSTWRVQPVVDSYDYEFIPTNSRDDVDFDIDASSDTSSDLTIASFNVLNYFVTLDVDGNLCGANGNLECRGADSEEEFIRQQAKLTSALCAMDADVVGLMELENANIENTEETAIENLVESLNTQCGPYASINTGAVGTDAITVGIIYKPENISPVGETAILDSQDFTNPNFHNNDKNRPAIAQSFEYSETNDVFTVVVNHLKSKGSDCEDGLDPNDDDTTTGQGNCNGTRTKAAEVEIAWLNSNPTGVDSDKILVIGDLNAYRNEDPITAFKNSGYTDIIDNFSGDEAYGFVFDGEWGYLDHALASDSFLTNITNARDIHINSDESVLLDYNGEFKPDNYETELYSDSAFRSSDHDPVLIGVRFTSTVSAPSFDSIIDAFKDAVAAKEIQGNGRFYWWRVLNLKVFSLKLYKTELLFNKEKNSLACASLVNLIKLSDSQSRPSDLIDGSGVASFNKNLVDFYNEVCER